MIVKVAVLIVFFLLKGGCDAPFQDESWQEPVFVQSDGEPEAGS